MVLSAIHLLNWFYSLSLNRLSLICFRNWKKKKKLVWKISVNPTWPNMQPDWPNPNPTRPTHFATSTTYRWNFRWRHHLFIFSLYLSKKNLILILYSYSYANIVFLARLKDLVPLLLRKSYIIFINFKR